MRRLEAPRIETARLILRSHQRSDYDAFAAMWRDPDVVRYTIGEPRNARDSWMTMQRLLGSWPLFGLGFWAVELRETGAFIGEAGFMYAMRSYTPSDLSEAPELGYSFARGRYGKGLASEAIAACVAWLDEALPGSESFAFIDPANPASIRVAQKAGYQFARDITVDDEGALAGLYTRKPLSQQYNGG